MTTAPFTTCTPNTMTQQCHWPALAEPYSSALHAAVQHILEQVPDILGIVASGSIIQGHPAATSDLDLYVVHRQPWRQRQKHIFAGVPAEIFINPPFQVRRYFAVEHQAGRPITAHLWATGQIILALDPEVEELQQEARQWLTQPPAYTPEQLTMRRYLAACRYEDATDIITAEAHNGLMLLFAAVRDMLDYAIMAAGHYLPREKDLLRALSTWNAPLAQLTRDFITATTLETRLQLAACIADATIATRGFFEWESTPQMLTSSPAPEAPTGTAQKTPSETR